MNVYISCALLPACDMVCFCAAKNDMGCLQQLLEERFPFMIRAQSTPTEQRGLYLATLSVAYFPVCGNEVKLGMVSHV